MSMISAQIDELRELAGDGSMEWVTGPIRASVLRDAADTIWQLRDDLQRTNAENAKLREDLEFERSENGWAREFLNRMGQKCGTKDCPSLVAYVTKLKAENAKLRKVANLISEYISYDRCEGCVVKTACNSHELDVCWMVTELRNQLRELGVGVDA